MRKFLTLALLLCLSACQSGSNKIVNTDSFPTEVELVTSAGEVIKTRIVVTLKDQEQGLSGVQPEDFGDKEGMLFFYNEEGNRGFWMPDTYFDLDLFCLNKELRIVDIVRKLPHYIGRTNPHLIPVARSVWSRHVLEMKASSPIANSLKIGDTLKWTSPISLQQAEALAKKVPQ